MQESSTVTPAAIHPAMHARRIHQVIASTRVSLNTEDRARDDIAKALEAAWIGCEREVRLSDRDRIDILAGSVGIEVKVRLEHSKRSIWEQLCRYSEHDEIGALVLATSRPFPALTEVKGKPLHVVSLSMGWL